MDDETNPPQPGLGPEEPGRIDGPRVEELEAPLEPEDPWAAMRPQQTPVWIPPPPPIRGKHLAVLVAILALSSVTHFARLANPDRPLPPTDEQCTKYPRLSRVCHEMIPLDEYHYLPDARDVIRFGTESDTRVPADDGAFVVHPPVGKWFIALGIKLFGDAGFGWRFFGALLGVTASLLMYLIARRLWSSLWIAAAAAFLISIEGLWFVMSRIAMLDIYMAFFLLAGVWMLLEDRARKRAYGRRWWRIGAALMFGLSLSSKWSSIWFIIVAITFAAAWEIKDAIGMPAEDRRIGRRISTGTASLLLIPGAVYVATFIPWFVDGHRYNPPRCVEMDGSWLSDEPVARALTGWIADTGRFGQWVCYQREMFDFHLHLEKFTTTTEDAAQAATASAPASASAPAALSASPSLAATPTSTPSVRRKPGHPYFGNAYAWPWAGRPVAHYYSTTDRKGTEVVKHVVGLPNPLIWWPAFFLGIPVLAFTVLRRRDGRPLFVLAMILAGWIPYLYADIVERGVFLFYATPLVPFLVLGLAWTGAKVVRALFSTERGRVIAATAALAVATATFAYLYPVIAAYPVPKEGWSGWSNRMWFNSRTLLIPGDCSTVDQIKDFCWI